ncbi:aminoglycoside phosphotransferase [Frankia torreyi]|uniref:Aminoglycoside phosphotransferase n=1 Tax=Frankia torreyi TaxID=1856 RepID=A0A0D8BLR8_9ACTN|nr:MULTISPECIES: aminoglycoside 3'-phosphotransferase [Frankia]KJE24352.1 aminoglycoside phosphotransferase [Frankia torreyi]KQC34909.1 aminoglycoside phosphotransferase [Frankia sp. ACN1ag]KQM06772.1 aminoglycoside phosphotransferase [Frankia sp. CpI1-P]
MVGDDGPVLGGAVEEGTAIPAAVVAVAAGVEVRPVWRNAFGGLTFELVGAPERRFLKWAPAGSGRDLAAEAVRLAWAAPFTAVPTVLDQGGDGAGSWLLTAGLPGRNAVEARWLADPGRAVRAVGVGLRALHDALPVAGCPFSWSVSDRRAAAAAVATTPAQRRLVDDLGDPPPPDLLVVCHGDACVPNTLLTDDGTCSGHVDLGALGVADRWADLAVATWSTVWNYGPGWETVLLDAYGVAPDDDRTAYYRRLWRLGP